MPEDDVILYGFTIIILIYLTLRLLGFIRYGKALRRAEEITQDRKRYGKSSYYKITKKPFSTFSYPRTQMK